MPAFPSSTLNSVYTSAEVLWSGIAYAILVNSLYARGWPLFTCSLTLFTERAKWTLHPLATFEATSSPTASSKPFIWWSDQSRVIPYRDLPTGKWGWSFFTASKIDRKHWAYAWAVSLFKRTLATMCPVDDKTCRHNNYTYTDIGTLYYVHVG